MAVYIFYIDYTRTGTCARRPGRRSVKRGAPVGAEGGGVRSGLVHYSPCSRYGLFSNTMALITSLERAALCQTGGLKWALKVGG